MSATCVPWYVARGDTGLSEHGDPVFPHFCPLDQNRGRVALWVRNVIVHRCFQAQAWAISHLLLLLLCPCCAEVVGAYWPLATAHPDPLWVRTRFGCVNGAPGGGAGTLGLDQYGGGVGWVSFLGLTACAPSATPLPGVQARRGCTHTPCPMALQFLMELDIEDDLDEKTFQLLELLGNCKLRADTQTWLRSAAQKIAKFLSDGEGLLAKCVDTTPMKARERDWIEEQVCPGRGTGARHRRRRLLRLRRARTPTAVGG